MCINWFGMVGGWFFFSIGLKLFIYTRLIFACWILYYFFYLQKFVLFEFLFTCDFYLIFTYCCSCGFYWYNLIFFVWKMCIFVSLCGFGHANARKMSRLRPCVKFPQVQFFHWAGYRHPARPIAVWTANEFVEIRTCSDLSVNGSSLWNSRDMVHCCSKYTGITMNAKVIGERNGKFGVWNSVTNEINIVLAFQWKRFSLIN